jgi:hypothetical protein
VSFASQGVFIIVVYFVIGSVRNLLDTSSCVVIRCHCLMVVLVLSAICSR